MCDFQNYWLNDFESAFVLLNFCFCFSSIQANAIFCASKEVLEMSEFLFVSLAHEKCQNASHSSEHFLFFYDKEELQVFVES